MKIFALILFLIPLAAHSLEVDEKLTVRLLKTSESRKTLMINRGTEDGLVEGDHARFIVTAGIVARGVCVRVSPTRSVWAVYRLVNADFIVNDAVMTIKITPPVKITKDESQALVTEDTPTKLPVDPAAVGIPLAEGAQDLATATEERLNDDDFRGLEDVTIVEKNWEVLGLVNISGLTSTTKISDGGGTFKDSQASHHIGLGAELYPQREREWWSRFSLLGGVDFMRLNSQSYGGFATTSDATEFNFGVNWHPGNMPSATYHFIPYLHLAFGIGTVKSSVSQPNVDDESSNGSTSSFSVGFGYKFYTKDGFGARALLDYYQRAEKYKEDDLGNSYNKVVAGPRFMLGISYRF